MAMSTDGASQPPSGWSMKLLTTLLVVSLAINVGLAYKVREFTNAQQAKLAKLESASLKAGMTVPAFSARCVDRLDGLMETIDYTQARQSIVLYILSPICGWCAKNERSIRQLIAEKGQEYRFLAISLSEPGAAEYANAHPLGVPLYTGLSEDTKKAYRMGGTPQTIVVSPKGVVIANWNGAYRGKQKDAIEKFFGVELPDIKVETSKR